MSKLTIFEPAMCCDTGVCGVDADTVLINFSADIEWLKNQGVNVQRFNLAQEPGAFIADPLVKVEINEHGESCLPLLLLDGRIVSRGSYPDRAQLQALAGVESAASLADAPERNTSKSGCGCGTGSSC